MATTSTSDKDTELTMLDKANIQDSYYNLYIYPDVSTKTHLSISLIWGFLNIFYMFFIMNYPKDHAAGYTKQYELEIPFVLYFIFFIHFVDGIVGNLFMLCQSIYDDFLNENYDEALEYHFEEIVSEIIYTFKRMFKIKNYYQNLQTYLDSNKLKPVNVFNKIYLEKTHELEKPYAPLNANIISLFNEESGNLELDKLVRIFVKYNTFEYLKFHLKSLSYIYLSNYQVENTSNEILKLLKPLLDCKLNDNLLNSNLFNTIKKDYHEFWNKLINLSNHFMPIQGESKDVSSTSKDINLMATYNGQIKTLNTEINTEIDKFLNDKFLKDELKIIINTYITDKFNSFFKDSTSMKVIIYNHKKDIANKSKLFEHSETNDNKKKFVKKVISTINTYINSNIAVKNPNNTELEHIEYISIFAQHMKVFEEESINNQIKNIYETYKTESQLTESQKIIDLKAKLHKLLQEILSKLFIIISDEDVKKIFDSLFNKLNTGLSTNTYNKITTEPNLKNILKYIIIKIIELELKEGEYAKTYDNYFNDDFGIMFTTTPDEKINNLLKKKIAIDEFQIDYNYLCKVLSNELALFLKYLLEGINYYLLSHIINEMISKNESNEVKPVSNGTGNSSDKPIKHDIALLPKKSINSLIEPLIDLEFKQIKIQEGPTEIEKLLQNFLNESDTQNSKETLTEVFNKASKIISISEDQIKKDQIGDKIVNNLTEIISGDLNDINTIIAYSLDICKKTAGINLVDIIAHNAFDKISENLKAFNGVLIELLQQILLYKNKESFIQEIEKFESNWSGNEPVIDILTFFKIAKPADVIHEFAEHFQIIINEDNKQDSKKNFKPIILQIILIVLEKSNLYIFYLFEAIFIELYYDNMLIPFNKNLSEKILEKIPYWLNIYLIMINIFNQIIRPKITNTKDLSDIIHILDALIAKIVIENTRRIIQESARNNIAAYTKIFGAKNKIVSTKNIDFTPHYNWIFERITEDSIKKMAFELSDIDDSTDVTEKFIIEPEKYHSELYKKLIIDVNKSTEYNKDWFIPIIILFKSHCLIEFIYCIIYLCLIYQWKLIHSYFRAFIVDLGVQPHLVNGGVILLFAILMIVAYTSIYCFISNILVALKVKEIIQLKNPLKTLHNAANIEANSEERGKIDSEHTMRMYGNLFEYIKKNKYSAIIQN